ncbi:hypothetical protein [Variovorax terrae]|uniref:Uncharacterized protein n=1 Tax=Variovorax terrae TaxID=2923278 RepID=A0A9X1VQZ5_9BURK|nr:hypothetical protein [Variovorax terrae]MCJ0762206.1 hypothetical protein [Variovorax terrae]
MNTPVRRVAELMAISHIDNAAFALEIATRDEHLAAQLHVAGEIDAEAQVQEHARHERELAHLEAEQFLSYCESRF